MTDTVHVQMSRRTAEKIRRTAEEGPVTAEVFGVGAHLPPEDVRAVLYALTVLTPTEQEGAASCP